MKTYAVLFVLMFCISVFYTNCVKEEEKEFENELLLGSGVNPTNFFELTGVGNTFIKVGASVILFFRLETEDDMAGNDVILDFETPDGNPINTISFEQAQDYGHIMVSQFEWLWMTGNYVVKAYLNVNNEKKFIASKNFTIQ